MDHITELALLLDTYGILLTSRQREILHLKTDEDFSLAEIAETCGISRQGAHDALHRAEQQLKAFESQLGLVRRGQTLQKALHCLYAAKDGDMAALQQAITLLEPLCPGEEQHGV